MASDAYALGLTTRSRGDAILIEWDRNSAAVKTAQRAVAIVTWSTGRQEVPIDTTELKTGVLLYKTDAAEAGVRLEVFVAPERLVAEQASWKRGSAVEH